MARDGDRVSTRLTVLGVAVTIAGLLLMHGLEAVTVHRGHVSQSGHVAQETSTEAEAHTMAGGCALLLALAVGLWKPRDRFSCPFILDMALAPSNPRRFHRRRLLDVLCILRV